MSETSEMIKRPVKMEPVHPGRILARILTGDEDNTPMSVTAAAKALGVTRQTLHRVLAGTTAVTLDMAQRLGAFAGNGPGLWLRMQSAYDLWHAEHSGTKPNVVPISEARKGLDGRKARKNAALRVAAKRAPKRTKTHARV